jgi:hypothetical protein
MNRIRKEVIRQRNELKEWNDSFDLYHGATMRATKYYRKIFPDFPALSHPDTGRMIHALCDRIIELENQVKNANKEFARGNGGGN